MAYNKGMTKKQKEAVGLLSIGTFLEYFDLMLYIHMSVFLNDLFFPQSNQLTSQLLTATTFCLTYIFRPIGGFIIGNIGDAFGRKLTVYITTFVMAVSCIVMANIKTYAEIGITATIIVMLCRMLQGFSSMGEIVGAELYISETFKSPHRYICNGLMFVSSRSGGMFALIVGSFVISIGFNWRVAFWIGAGIAVIGFIARTRLRETPEFVSYKKRIKNKHAANRIANNILKKTQSISFKAIAAYFFIKAIDAVCMYMTFIYMGDFMKQHLVMSSKQVIYQNLKITVIIVMLTLLMIKLIKKFHPIKVISASLIIFSIYLPLIPFWLNNVTDITSLTFLQVAIFFPALSSFGVETTCFKHFPIASRFTILATTFGMSASLSYAAIAFGSIFFVNYFGYYGLLYIYVPLLICVGFSINYFKKLEIKKGLYYSYPNENFPFKDTAIKEKDFQYHLGKEYDVFQNNCKYKLELINDIKEIVKEENIKINIKLIEKAITFTKKWHGNQMRKTGSEPFYSHPLAVAGEVAKHYFKTDVMVAAVLHDVLEDTSCTVEIIKQEFNWRIAEIVERLTKIQFKDGKKIKLTFSQMLNKLAELQDYEALFIKKIDRMHNLKTIRGLNLKKQKRMRSETANFLIGIIALISEKLGIYDKIELENKIFNLSHKTFSKNNSNHVKPK
jgi:MFS family permease